MPTQPSISGTTRSPTLTGAVGQWIGVGTPTTLPVTLSNDRLALRFVAHATYGVTLDTVTQLDTAESFAWTNAQASDDQSVTGQLWRIVTQGTAGRETSSECGAECGRGMDEIDPGATVDVSTTEDGDGRPALCFRWQALALPTSGTIDVTLFVALSTDDTCARWSCHVVRAGAEADGIEYVEAPILAIVGPVAARAATTHAASQVRARVLLPAQTLPDLGSENVPLSLWSGESLTTQHPGGDDLTPTQPLQFCALYAGDRQDTDSFGRVLFLGSADRRGHTKTFTHAGTLAGTTLIFRWAHRYVPAWASWPILDTDSTTRAGNVFHASYPVLTAAVVAPTAAWWHTAAALYRDTVADAMPAVGRRRDTERTDLARGLPFTIDRTTDAGIDGQTAAHIAETWADEHRQIAGASAGFAQVNNLQPAGRTLPTPALEPNAFRGTNWLPLCDTWSHCLHLSFLPVVANGSGRPTNAGGFFHEPFVTASLDKLEAIGFNTIRLWGSYLAWRLDPNGYLTSLRTISRLCAERNIGITYIMWNQIPAGTASGVGSAFTLETAAAYDTGTLRTALWSLCDAWQTANGAPTMIPADELDLTHLPEPLTGAEWITQGRFDEWTDRTFQGHVRDYIRDMATFWGSDPDGAAAYRSTDLYNEVSIILSSAAREPVLDFIVQMERAMRAIHPGMVTTVGWAGDPSGLDRELTDKGCVLSYLSQHQYVYSGEVEEFAASILGERKTTATEICDRQLVLSECFVVPENKGQMQLYLDEMAAQSCGGQVWCVLKNNAWSDRSLYGTTPPTTFSWPFDGIWKCTTPAEQLTTSTTVEWRLAGGECNTECSRECSSGYTDDATAITAWTAT